MMKQSFITQNILGGEIYYSQIEHPILQINKKKTLPLTAQIRFRFTYFKGQSSMVKGWFKHKQLDTKILIFYMQINELQSECLFLLKSISLSPLFWVLFFWRVLKRGCHNVFHGAKGEFLRTFFIYRNFQIATNLLDFFSTSI